MRERLNRLTNLGYDFSDKADTIEGLTELEFLLLVITLNKVTPRVAEPAEKGRNQLPRASK